ncbi:MAG TPA: hypothetical protein DDZ81_07900 [Acetobacteraceae bacterium]|jgi:prophage tail gpP-like protein|nr:hypothetical protein [Acetobacteraceae bacterium]
MLPVPAPVIEVTIDGTPISGLLWAYIVTTNSFSADTYALTFAIGVQPQEDIGFWSSLTAGTVEVGADYNSLITGIIDTIRIDPIRGVATIEGRDLSGRLVDCYRQQDFVNQTASEVVSTIARYHGLPPVVTTTEGNIGRYYADGYTKLSLGQFSRSQSDWDLIVQLAREAAFDVFVQGTSLYFQPPTSATTVPIALSLRDVQALYVDRNINMANNSSAQVQSWNSRDMVSYSSLQAQQSGASGSPSLPFLFSGSNYTAQQVTDTMSQYTAELGRLTTTLRIEMPWNAALTPRTIIMLSGTGSALDTTYRVDTVERRFSASSGSEQTIYACQV